MSETVFLEIKGMHCPDCPAKVERSLAKLDGIGKVKVDYEKESGYITYDKSRIRITEITETIHELGFEASNIEKAAK